MSKKTEKCSFKGCIKPVYANGLCEAHNRQQARGADLRPLRARGLVRLGSIRVSPECAEALERQGPTATAAAKKILETWANKK